MITVRKTTSHVVGGCTAHFQVKGQDVFDVRFKFDASNASTSIRLCEECAGELIAALVDIPPRISRRIMEDAALGRQVRELVAGR